MNSEYFFERVLLRYSDSNIDTVIKLLVRGKRMYEAIDNILLMFSLLGRIEVSLFHFENV